MENYAIYNKLSCTWGTRISRTSAPNPKTFYVALVKVPDIPLKMLIAHYFE